MLEQRLGELARGAELVAELSERYGTATPLPKRYEALPNLREDVGVVVECSADSDRPAVLAERGEVSGVELGVERGFEAGGE